MCTLKKQNTRLGLLFKREVRRNRYLQIYEQSLEIHFLVS